MPANSLPRRILKRLLVPVLNESTYGLVQTAAMSWDIRSGTWTEPELDLVKLALRPGETAIDIGANYGLYSYHLDRAVAPDGRVLAFEPVPFTSRTFRRIAKLLRFRNVELFDKAVGAAPGTLKLSVPISESGSIIAGIVHASARDNERPGKAQHARFDRTKEIEVEVVALDRLLRDARDVALVKCDIEGYDYFAMKGAVGILERDHPTVIIEINPWFVEGLGLKVADLVELFTSRGYGLYRYVDGRLSPKTLADVEEDNWIFVHPSRADRLRSVL